MLNVKIKRRIIYIGGILILLSVVLTVKLFCKQTDFSRYDEKIFHQSVRKIRIPARRGRIYSADYKIVADNRMTFNLMLYIHEIRRPGRNATIDAVENALLDISLVLGRENKLTRKDIIRHLNWYPGLPLLVFSDLNERERAVANDYISDHPGWGLDIMFRSFTQNEFAFAFIVCGNEAFF